MTHKNEMHGEVWVNRKMETMNSCTRTQTPAHTHTRTCAHTHTHTHTHTRARTHRKHTHTKKHMLVKSLSEFGFRVAVP